jgi:hypothetical protein
MRKLSTGAPGYVGAAGMPPAAQVPTWRRFLHTVSEAWGLAGACTTPGDFVPTLRVALCW